MEETFIKLKESIYEVFPDIDSIAIIPDMKLGDIPDWDSMAAINLQTYLEQHHRISIPEEILGDDTTINEVIQFVETP